MRRDTRHRIFPEFRKMAGEVGAHISQLARSGKRLMKYEGG